MSSLYNPPIQGNCETIEIGSTTYSKTYVAYEWTELATVTFDTTFATAPRVVIDITNNGGDALQLVQPRNITTTGFTLYGYCISASTVTNSEVNYIAAG